MYNLYIHEHTHKHISYPPLPLPRITYVYSDLTSPSVGASDQVRSSDGGIGKTL